MHSLIQRGGWNSCNFTMQKEKKKEIVIKRVYLFDILFKHVYNVNKHKIVPPPPEKCLYKPLTDLLFAIINQGIPQNLAAMIKVPVKKFSIQ